MAHEINFINQSQIEEAKKYFGSNIIQPALFLLKQSKVSISFKKESPENYFIISGLVRDDRSHEVKVVYKKRYEGTETPPLTSNCDCQLWSQNAHCKHSAALYLCYIYQSGLQEHSDFSNDSLNPPIVLDSGLGVCVNEYGTIINGPHQLVGAPLSPTYSALSYVLHNKKTIPFPIPENFTGKLIFSLSEERKPQIRWISPEGAIFHEVTLFENQYLFNWKLGKAYHLTSEMKNFIQRVRLNQFNFSFNDYFLNIRELNIENLIELYYEDKPFAELPRVKPHIRLAFTPSTKKGMIFVALDFFNENQVLVQPPELFSFLCHHNGILNIFKKKQESYEFISLLAESVKQNNDNYKRGLLASSKKNKIIQIFNELLTLPESVFYDHLNKEIVVYDNYIIKELFLNIVQNFSDQFFRFAKYDSATNQLTYEIQPTLLFQGLSEFHRQVTLYGVNIFYDRNEITKWNSRIRFERRSSSTKWFDLELNIDEQDLKVITSAEIESGIVITNKGMILLTKEQKDLIRFIQKYTKYESTSEQTTIDGSKTFKKFILPFNRSRIFELFELKKLGIDGALNEEEIALCNKLSSFDSIPSYPIPLDLNNILRPYQITGFNWLSFLYEHKLGACLADDMGLGKTLQTITFLQSIYDKISKVLIVCPVTILLNWEKEIQKFSNMEIQIYHGGKRNFSDQSKIILTSYGVMKKESDDVFSQMHFDVMVLDEVQHLKNVRSLGAFSARKIKADFRICLTGTPVENDLSEFYNILDLSMPGIWGDLQFVRAISNTKSRGIAKRTASPFILRRTKNQVLKELPPKIENNIYLEMSESELDHYQKSLITIKAKINATTTSAKYGEILKGLLQLRQMCLWQDRSQSHVPSKMESTKIEFLLETLESLLEEGHQAIIFSQFTTYLDIIQFHFKEKHWKYSRIDGSQSINKRQEQVDLFQSQKTPLFLISLKAGGVGLNLTAASYVFIMDPWWNPAVESQAIDRAHRIGQQNTLTVYRPIIKNSVEEKVLKLQEEKKQLFNDLLTSDDDTIFSGKLSMKDFEKLFN